MFSPGQCTNARRDTHAYLPHTCNPWRDAGADAQMTALRSRFCSLLPGNYSPGCAFSSYRTKAPPLPSLVGEFSSCCSSPYLFPPLLELEAAGSCSPYVPESCTPAAVLPLLFPWGTLSSHFVGSHLELPHAQPGSLREEHGLNLSFPIPKSGRPMCPGLRHLRESFSSHGAFPTPHPPSVWAIPPIHSFRPRPRLSSSTSPNSNSPPPHFPSSPCSASPPPHWVSRPGADPAPWLAQVRADPALPLLSVHPLSTFHLLPQRQGTLVLLARSVPTHHCRLNRASCREL